MLKFRRLMRFMAAFLERMQADEAVDRLKGAVESPGGVEAEATAMQREVVPAASPVCARLSIVAEQVAAEHGLPPGVVGSMRHVLVTHRDDIEVCGLFVSMIEA